VNADPLYTCGGPAMKLDIPELESFPADQRKQLLEVATRSVNASHGRMSNRPHYVGCGLGRFKGDITQIAENMVCFSTPYAILASDNFPPRRRLPHRLRYCPNAPENFPWTRRFSLRAGSFPIAWEIVLRAGIFSCAMGCFPMRWEIVLAAGIFSPRVGYFPRYSFPDSFAFSVSQFWI
jgi:hypothetical protein